MNPMIYLRRLAATVATLLLLASPAAAQGFKWWASDQYKRELSLTPEQSRRLEDTFQAALPTLRAQKKALDDAEKQFQQEIERGNYASVMEQVDQLEASRAALNRSRTLMLVNMRKVLTTDQWIKLDAMHQAAERRKADAARGSK
jgi:Spy/CpxP family protein refolding chaperone